MAERYEPPKLVRAQSLHILIYGQTTSGKSVLGKIMAQKYLDSGVGVMVFTPLPEQWPCHFQTSDISEFVEIAMLENECALFVDEGSEVFNLGRKENHILATRGRHRGHRLHVLAQRGFSAIAPIVRDQASDLYLFNVSLYDARKLADEWNDETILNAAELPPGTCIHKRRMKPAREIKIFDVE